MKRRGRPPSPGLLTPREREVAELVGEGLTNPEIAERLGVSEGAIRYHLNSIYSKTGLQFREDLVRWSKRRAPWVAGIGLLKAGAGVVAVAGAIAVGVVAIAMATGDGGSEGTGGDDRVEEVDAFYIEAEAVVRSSRGGDFASASDEPSPTPDTEVTATTVRWWSKSPGEFRQEFDRADGSDGGETTVVVGDGEQRHSYTARDNTYQSSDLPEVPEGVIAWPLPGGYVGPVPMQRGGSPQDAAFALVERWIPVRAGQPVAELTEGGGDTVAGRPARVFEAVGISCELAPPMPGSSSPTLGECGGYMRAWVDHETGFILRYIRSDEWGDARDELIDITVTHIEYNPDFDDDLFEFDPPPGAVAQE